MPCSLHEILLHQFPATPRQRFKNWVGQGRVMADGRLARRLDQVVADSQSVQILPRGQSASAARPAPPFVIVYEDCDLLVVDKPAGLLTSTVPREKRPTLLAMVRQYYASQPSVRVGLIHRLDRDASGLLIFSKTPSAYQALKRQFFEHTVERIYLAHATGNLLPAKGVIRSRLVEHADGTVHLTANPAAGELAITEYQVVGQDDAGTWVRVRLQTGKKHQIRVQLAGRGAPILGVVVYG